MLWNLRRYGVRCTSIGKLNSIAHGIIRRFAWQLDDECGALARACALCANRALRVREQFPRAAQGAYR